jgi:hypothetical protein
MQLRLGRKPAGRASSWPLHCASRPLREGGGYSWRDGVPDQAGLLVGGPDEPKIVRKRLDACRFPWGEAAVFEWVEEMRRIAELRKHCVRQALSGQPSKFSVESATQVDSLPRWLPKVVLIEQRFHKTPKGRIRAACGATPIRLPRCRTRTSSQDDHGVQQLAHVW